jgi:lactate racemase
MEKDSPVRAHLQLRSFTADLVLPAGTEVLRTREPDAIADVYEAVQQALSSPLGGLPLSSLCRNARENAAPRPPAVVVVVSDNTRPVPYRGEGGILKPLLESLFLAGISPRWVTLLVATGTHRVLSVDEIWALFDPVIRETGVRVRCHDAADRGTQVPVGRTLSGAEVTINRDYVEADLRILTGLVEPHLMAGVSGGRKSICPGLVGVQSVRDFHGAKTLMNPKATDLLLEGNPCHEMGLEIARMAPPDIILNVTICQDGRVAGVFAGDMEQAHVAAFDHVRGFAGIRLEHLYDVVVAHSGLVGVNHYQAEKAAAIAAKAVRDGGYVVIAADTTDPDPVGTSSYRHLLKFLTEVGPEAFLVAIQADDWEFVHDQWGAQVWAQLLARVPRDHIYYFSPQTSAGDYPMLACVYPPPLSGLLEGCGAGESVASFVSAAVARASAASEAKTGRPATVAYLADGPHGIPIPPAVVKVAPD